MENFIFTGYLAKNAELKSSNDGKLFLTMSIAIQRKVQNPTPQDGRGDKIDMPKWVSCTWGRDNAHNILPYLTAGSLVCVRGTVEAYAYIGNDKQLKGQLSCRVAALDILHSKRVEETVSNVSNIAQNNASNYTNVPNMSNNGEKDDMPF